MPNETEVKQLEFDPEAMKELFGDDYEKYMPMGFEKSGTKPKLPGERERKDEPKAGRFYSLEVSPPDAAGHGRIPPANDIPEEPELPEGQEDFDVTFDFDKEYRDVPENRPLRQRREKRSGCLGGLLFSVFVIAVSLMLAALMWLAASDVLGLSGADVPVGVYVPKNYSIDEISDILYDNGLIKYKFLFKMYAGFSNAEKTIVPGAYTLNQNFDYRALVQGMAERSKMRIEVTVSIPEGHTMAQIFSLLEANDVCSANELWDAAANYDFNYSFLDKKSLGDMRRLEGYLFPNTYNFYVDSKPEQAISKLLSEFNKKFSDEYIGRAKELDMSIRDIVIIASMIEKEAGADEERAKIASVIYNRLANPDFPHLQIDATIYYAMSITGEPFSRNLNSPYNTDVCEGLPAGPISNPGLESIKAALYPEATDFYFYALGKSGTHEFFQTRSAHEAFVASDEYGG